MNPTVIALTMIVAIILSLRGVYWGENHRRGGGENTQVRRIVFVLAAIATWETAAAMASPPALPAQTSLVFGGVVVSILAFIAWGKPGELSYKLGKNAQDQYVGAEGESYGNVLYVGTDGMVYAVVFDEEKGYDYTRRLIKVTRGEVNSPRIS